MIATFCVSAFVPLNALQFWSGIIHFLSLAGTHPPHPLSFFFFFLNFFFIVSSNLICYSMMPNKMFQGMSSDLSFTAEDDQLL